MVMAILNLCAVQVSGDKWGRLTSRPVRLSDAGWQHDNARSHDEKSSSSLVKGT